MSPDKGPTVEGVENAKQAAFLDLVDGDQAQGFFFGRPIPASDIAVSILTNFRKAQTKLLPGIEPKKQLAK
jgi:EAL domain-containing protein (putative c-di-GMP-specific phosphodiesterase class I)